MLTVDLDLAPEDLNEIFEADFTETTDLAADFFPKALTADVFLDTVDAFFDETLDADFTDTFDAFLATFGGLAAFLAFVTLDLGA